MGSFPIGSNAIYISTALFRSADPSSPHITCKRRMRSAHPDCRSVSHYLAYGAWRILERAAKPLLTIYPFWFFYPRPSSSRVHPLSALGWFALQLLMTSGRGQTDYRYWPAAVINCQFGTNRSRGLEHYNYSIIFRPRQIWDHLNLGIKIPFIFPLPCINIITKFWRKINF